MLSHLLVLSSLVQPVCLNVNLSLKVHFDQDWALIYEWCTVWQIVTDPLWCLWTVESKIYLSVCPLNPISLLENNTSCVKWKVDCGQWTVIILYQYWQQSLITTIDIYNVYSWTCFSVCFGWFLYSWGCMVYRLKPFTYYDYSYSVYVMLILKLQCIVAP
jgi:hypothetical protein